MNDDGGRKRGERKEGRGRIEDRERESSIRSQDHWEREQDADEICLTYDEGF